MAWAALGLTASPLPTGLLNPLGLLWAELLAPGLEEAAHPFGQLFFQRLDHALQPPHLGHIATMAFLEPVDFSPQPDILLAQAWL
jgi:hypothetical protein